MRPQTLDELFGLEAVIGPDQPLRRALERELLPSLILWGPPGSGKTTLAEIIARSSQAVCVRLSAVSAGVADLRKAIEEAKRLQRAGHRTLLFIDEIHRFNRAQQDAVLPYVEDGTISLIGATTENPSFEVNAALLSRARVVVMPALSNAAMHKIVRHALSDHERGLGKLFLKVDDDALDHLVGFANGDARTALNALEFAASAVGTSEQPRHITLIAMRQAITQRSTGYDKTGDAHYTCISALIKSMRGSDADAAMYWLARMIEGGEDPLFLARRLMIFASEDIGLADQQALPIAVAAQQTVHCVGMPEGFYALSHATLYLALAPKSRAVGNAYAAALHDVQQTRNEPVPLHLRNTPLPASALGHIPAPTTEFRPANVAHHRYLEPDFLT